jgi:hypothetical protein
MSNEDHELHFEMGAVKPGAGIQLAPKRAESSPPHKLRGSNTEQGQAVHEKGPPLPVARAHRDPVLWERLVSKIKAELDSGSANYQGLTQAAGRVTLDDTRHATEHYWLAGTLALVTSPRCASGVITPYPLTASRQFCRPSLTKGRGLTVSAYRR